MNISRRPSYASLGYSSLLVTVTSLGFLSATLALGHDVAAAVSGVALIASFGGAVAAFRATARRNLAASRAVGGEDHTTIFGTPLSRDDIDRYWQQYRGISPASHRAPAEGRGRRVLTHVG